MKTNNRPKIKLVEGEVRTKSDFLLGNSPDDTAIGDGERTGNTREVERPMNDTEYIEYLEKRNQVLEKIFEKASKDNSTYDAIQLNRFKDRQEYGDNLKIQQDQFLKVVESVLRTHKETETIVNETKDTITYDAVCACGFKEYSSREYRQHLLQEIKSAIEKGKE